MEGWKTYQLESLLDDIAMGPFGSNIKTDNFISAGVPVIRGQNLNSGRFNNSNFVYISEQKAYSLKRSLAYPDDLVFTHRGTLGQVGIIPKNQSPYYLVSQSQLKITVKKAIVAPLFLYYFFKSDTGQYELLKNVSQVGVPAIASPTKSLKEVEINLPPLHIQHRIADILGALDDKIELNRQMNHTLEQVAQALYKHYFVDGIDPKNLPEGWRIGTLGDIIRNFDSKRVPLSKMQRVHRKGIFPYYGATSIMDYVDDYLFDGDYVLLAEDGSVQDDDGFPILQRVNGKFWVNNHAHILQAIIPFDNNYLYYLLKNTRVNHTVTGAVQPKINQANLNGIKVLIPSSARTLEYQSLVHNYIDLIKSNNHEVDALSNCRDTLLPKLISGELIPADLQTIEQTL